MLSESQKRKGHLSILEKLRAGGMPNKGDGSESGSEGGMEMMFAELGDEGDIISGEEEKKKKKKKGEDTVFGVDPNAEVRPFNGEPTGVKNMKNAFRKRRE